MSTGNVPANPLTAEHYPVSLTARSQIPSISLPGRFTILSSTIPIVARLEVNPDFSFSCLLRPQSFKTLFLKHHGQSFPNPTSDKHSSSTHRNIGVFAKLNVNGTPRMYRFGAARTEFGGVRFSFVANVNVYWYRVIFIGDNTATAVVDWYIIKKR